MNKWIKRSGFTLLGLASLAAATLVIAAQLGERKAQRRIAVNLQSLPLRSDAASIERGRYLFMTRGCTECHGQDGAGRDVINDGKGMRVHAPNITPAPGTVVASYGADDWERTIRHGVAPDGRPLMIMPSEDYNRLTDVDLASMVAYLRHMPATAGGPAVIELPLPLMAMYGAGLLRDSAEKIDHRLPPSTPVPEAPTAGHGAYVVNACIGCHGERLAGGKIPGTPPDWPPAANLTPGEGSAMTRYADAQTFAAMMRSGKRPDGSEISKVMPFAALKAMHDTDLQAIYLHLKGLAPRAAGSH
jgi:mono/diheme cytochrome c family protein